MPHDHPGITPLEGLAALWGIGDWCEHEWRAQHQPAVTPVMAALNRQTRRWAAEARQQRAAQHEETSMPRTNPYGRITKAEFEWHAALARELWRPEVAEQRIEAWRLLVDDPAADVRASAGRGDDGDDDEDFSYLWPPGSRENPHGRQPPSKIAASAAAARMDSMDEDEQYEAFLAALWPEGER